MVNESKENPTHADRPILITLTFPIYVDHDTVCPFPLHPDVAITSSENYSGYT